ncbi:MAG: fumarate reductase subunit C [Gammaproteobacteria bacterium]|nr:fumarate reductase subunit C [Gammaproteobacteria bacterium]
MSRRPYIRELSKTGWWLKQPRYIRYMMREISALFIGIYVLVLIAGLFRLSQGQAAYDAFLATAEGPVGLTFAVVALVFALYHTYTWFAVTPKAMPLMISGKPVPGAFIVAAHWLGFVVVSAALWLLVGR